MIALIAAALLAVSAQAQTIKYDLDLQWIEPTQNVDGSPIDDLDRYEAEIYVVNVGAVHRQTYKAPNAAPQPESRLQRAIPDAPIAGGQRLFVLLRACDAAVMPSGEAQNNCSAWEKSNEVIVPSVDLTAPDTPREISISISITMP